ncbi:MAG: outer membrane beta-barrel protein [Candidatus Omnitrophica bacterium]|nr:outer membrane beta-barrel protein [Candidatus Omnitrophota bacterium]
MQYQQRTLLLRVIIIAAVCLIGVGSVGAYAETEPDQNSFDVLVQEAQGGRLSAIRKFLDNLTPYVELKTTINDNIFLTTEDIEGDFVTEISPGVRYGDLSSQKKTNIFVDTGILVKQYAEHDEHNVENPYFSFLVSHGLGMFALTLDYRFIKEQATLTDLSLTTDEGFVDYLEHYPKLSLDVNWNRFRWEMAYLHRDKAYEEGDFRTTHSYKADTVSFTGSLRIASKTYAFLEYDHEWKDFYKGGSVDRDRDEYWIGVRGDIFSKIKGLIKFGYEEGHYPEEHVSSNAVNINLDYLLSRRFILNVNAEQGVGASSISTDELDSYSNFGFGFRYFPPFNRKLKLISNVSFNFDEYESGRQDKQYNILLSSEYTLTKQLKIIGNYEFEKIGSDSTLAEHDNNIVSLKLSMDF